MAQQLEQAMPSPWFESAPGREASREKMAPTGPCHIADPSLEVLAICPLARLAKIPVENPNLFGFQPIDFACSLDLDWRSVSPD